MHVPHPLAEGGDIHALGPDDPLHGRHRRAEHRPQGGGFGVRKLGEGLHVPPRLQLAGIGPGAGVVRHLPPRILKHHAARDQDAAGQLGADTAMLGDHRISFLPVTRTPVGYSRAPGAGKPRSLDGPQRAAYHSISRLCRPLSGGRDLPRSIDGEAPAAVLEGLKARLDQLLREGARSDPRAYAAGLREALLEARLGVGALRKALAATGEELASERKLLEDAERRGRLAQAVPDAETVAIAARFAARHRERVGVLERKLAVQRDEVALAERELAEVTAELQRAAAGHPSESVAAAWRDLEAAGATRPDEEATLQADTDRQRRERAIEEQLAYLKKKLGKQ